MRPFQEALVFFFSSLVSILSESFLFYRLCILVLYARVAESP